MKNSRGFSIIELVIAVSLASFVLVGVATIAAQMARSQVEGIRAGTVTGWSVISYVTMAKEIEDANVLAFPSADLATSDSIVICKNWSRNQGTGPPGGMLDSTGLVSVIQYCLDSTAPTNLILRRYANVGAAVACPNPGAAVACVSAPGGTWTEIGIVGFRVEKLAPYPNIFERSNAIGGVKLHYVIGRQTSTTNEPIPKSTPFDFGIAMQKQYSNTSD